MHKECKIPIGNNSMRRDLYLSCSDIYFRHGTSASAPPPPSPCLSFRRHKCTPTQWKEFHISRGSQSHLSSLRDSRALLPLHGLNNNESVAHADRLPPCIQHDSMRQQPFVLVKRHRKARRANGAHSARNPMENVL